MGQRRVTLMIVVAGLALLCVGVASARQDAFDTRITIHEVDTGSYRGRVFSDLKACVGHRPIELWHRQSGPDMKIHNLHSKPHGRWNFTFAGDHYYVIAKRVKVGPHDKVCREDRSPTT
jgi:hypothetical protein